MCQRGAPEHYDGGKTWFKHYQSARRRALRDYIWRMMWPTRLYPDGRSDRQAGNRSDAGTDFTIDTTLSVPTPSRWTAQMTAASRGDNIAMVNAGLYPQHIDTDVQPGDN
ncbi:hypothetical protein KCP78_21600 [Salmonella enterica subsp. enterica]|nr:hypothetical protein KCP78_21600 [Salmonella enterica subsp. enterica]